MKTFKIKVYEVHDEKKPIKQFKSRVVPEQGDEIEIKKNHFLHVEHRVFNSDNPDDIKIYGYIDEAG